MFLGIPGLNKFISNVTVSQLDDMADRCNYFYTVLMLLFFSVLIGTKQHFGAPIRCLVDRQYSDSWVGYVHDYCFISERYSLTPPEYETDEIAAFDPTSEKKYENYYQWVPFLLAVQALAFYVPHFLWRWLQKLSNLDMAIAVDETVRIYNMFADERNKAIKDLGRYLEQCVDHRIQRSFLMKFVHFGYVGCYSSLVYVLEKLLNIGNTILQLYVVNIFVGDGTLLWSYQLLKDLLMGQDWTNTGHFPRIVYCDYVKYELANVQRKTVQCALSINILNEKVFALMSAWFLLLLAINVISAIYTIVTLFMLTSRERSISNYLQAFAYKGGPFNDILPDNGDEFYKRELSEDRFSNITSASFHSKIRRRLCAAADCGENRSVENEKNMREFEEQEEVILTRRLVSTAYKNKVLLHNFVVEAVHPDSILLLRFIHSHAGGMVTSDIVFALWCDYVRAKESKRRKFQPGIANNVTAGAPIWKKESEILDGNRYFNMAPSEVNSTIMDTGPLLKANEEYAQVADFVDRCSS